MKENKKKCLDSAPGKEFYAEYHDRDVLCGFYIHLCIHASSWPSGWTILPIIGVQIVD